VTRPGRTTRPSATAPSGRATSTALRSTATTRYRQWKQQWPRSMAGHAAHALPSRPGRYGGAASGHTGAPEPSGIPRSSPVREGRIWRGRDEILKLRENRDRVNPDIAPGPAAAASLVARTRERPGQDSRPTTGNAEAAGGGSAAERRVPQQDRRRTRGRQAQPPNAAGTGISGRAA